MMKIELKEGEYSIPKELAYRIVGRTLVVKKKTDRWRKDGDYRCKECANRVIGFCVKTSKYTTWVCSKKPKGKGLFYGAPEHGGKGCKMFKKKDND